MMFGFFKSKKKEKKEKTVMEKKIGMFLVVSLKNGTVSYVRHNGAYTENPLLAKKFGSPAEAAAYAKGANLGKTEDEVRENGLHAVEVVLKEIEVS